MLFEVPSNAVTQNVENYFAGCSTSPSDDIELESRIYSKINIDLILGPEDVIAVTVRSGNANLGGIVNTWKEHRQATHDAFQAGAKTVLNHIRVREDPSRSERKFFFTQDPIR